MTVITPENAFEDYVAAAGPGGAYAFPAVPLGTAYLRAVSMPGGIQDLSKAVTFQIKRDGQIVQDIDLTPGTAAVLGEVQVPTASPANVGLVLGDVTIPDLSMVTLLDLSNSLAAFDREVEGPFRFEGLDPGIYTLFAIVYEKDSGEQDDPFAGALFDQEVLTLNHAEERTINLYPAEW